MKTRELNMKFAVIILLLIFPVMLQAQSKTATTVGQFLKIEPSARASAMGGASTSLFGEASSMFYNPASLGRLERSDVQFTHNRWLADITYNYAGLGLKVEGLGSFSLQATSLSSGEIDVRTVEHPMGTGERYTVSDFALGLGFGLMLTDRVSVGILVNYVTETIWHSSLAAFGVNFGVQYQVVDNGLTLGASLSNFGPRAGYSGRDVYVNYDFDPRIYGNNDMLPAALRTETYSLPTTFRAGLSLPLRVNNSNMFLLSADAIHSNDNEERVNLGASWNFMNFFELRGGYRDLFLPDAVGGLTLGAGLRYSFIEDFDVKFDYSWADYGPLEQAHRFTLGFGF